MKVKVLHIVWCNIAGEAAGKSLKLITLKARLHMRFSMRFWCDFDAILRTKSAPVDPARVYSRVTPRQNTVKLAEIRKKGVLE